MASENERLEYLAVDGIEGIDFYELEAKLQADLDEDILELEFLKEDREKISNPDSLGNTIKEVVWEQFINQVAVTAGEDFIKENRGLTLDLRDDAHIQTAENFEKGKIANHNHKSADELSRNYDRFKNTSHKEFRRNHVNPSMDETLMRAGQLNKDGVEAVRDIYNGRQIPTKTKLADGKNNPKSAQREHVTPSAEIYKDSSLQMANDDSKLGKIINNPENLQGYTTAERNNRKSDYAADRMDSKDKNKHWENADKKSKEYLDKERKDGEKRVKDEGRESQKDEALKIGGSALRAILMQLFAGVMKEIMGKLVLWLKAGKRNMETLLGSIKSAIGAFVKKLKEHVLNTGNTLMTTVATAIYGPIVGAIKKVWIMLKQGWKSLKEAVAYIKNPDNKNKPFGILILEVGKIVTAGLAAVGAIALGEAIEKGLLLAIPGFAFEIPMLGSLASLIGLFLGGLIAGVVGAIAINLIDKSVSKRQTALAIEKEIKKGNEILDKQNIHLFVNEAAKDKAKENAIDAISSRHAEAAILIKDAVDGIFSIESEIVVSENDHKIDDLFDSLRKLQE